MKKYLFALLAALSLHALAVDNFNIADNTSATISGGTIDNTVIGGTMPAAARVTTLRVGNANDLYLTRYDAKQLMISGDGVGATTNAGLILGYFGSPDYGAIWSSSVGLPSGTNYILTSNGIATYLSGTSLAHIAVGGVQKLTVAGALNTSINPLSITDTTDSSSTTTGSLKAAGGLGVAKQLWVGGLSSFWTGTDAIIRFDAGSAANVNQIRSLNGASSAYKPLEINAGSTTLKISDVAVAEFQTGYAYLKNDIRFDKTITAPGTTGAQTINKTTGRVNFAAAATSLVVTNSLATANSICHVTKATNDATMRLGACVAAAGTITIYADVAPAAETAVNFTITN